MASYHCRACNEHYPKDPAFDDCPVCNETTRYLASKTPTVDKATGLERKRVMERYRAFAAWCEANGRGEGDLPPAPKLVMHTRRTKKAVELAVRVLEGLDDEFGPLAELHVFKS